MRSFLSSIVCLLFISSAFGQKSDPKVSTPDPNKKVQVVETACGECQFKLAGKGCDLAVRIDGKAYFVDGTDIDSHGDAHAEDGFCKAVRKAEVQGNLVNDRFKVTYFKLLKEAEKKEQPTIQKN
ncbi:MAG TPA: DUF6370 family protein [Chitinophagaceae bacterium]|jgi:hypothetical protein